jgi:hypothetical protein
MKLLVNLKIVKNDPKKLLQIDATRLMEELCQEQDHALQVERLRKVLEQQVKDLQIRLDEAEGNSLKGEKHVIAKLEQRVRNIFVFSKSENYFFLFCFCSFRFMN